MNVPVESYGYNQDLVIILRGGPHDGKEMVIPSEVNKVGRFKFARLSGPMWVPEEVPLVEAHVPVEYDWYIRKTMYAGKRGTCEFRQWKEWHYLND